MHNIHLQKTFLGEGGVVMSDVSPGAPNVRILKLVKKNNKKKGKEEKKLSSSHGASTHGCGATVEG